MSSSALIVVMALAIQLSAVPAAGQDNITGHVWRRFPEAVKLAYVSAYMDGYSTGYAIGNGKGFEKIVTWAKTKICGESDVVCQQLQTQSAAKEVFAPGSWAVKFGGHKMTHYVGEIDSFFEAYPLCRGESLSLKMLDFVLIWSEAYTSYQEIGAKCGAKK